METNLNWLIIGAGAIGTYMGGNLILHGHRVVFLEKPAAASQLQERGLKLNIKGQEYRILHPDVFSSVSEALKQANFDLSIFALKSYDTIDALEIIRPYSSSFPPVFSLQNGVENESAIEVILGKNKVIAGTITSSVQRRGAGDILLERLRGVGVANNHPLSAKIAQVLSSTGIRVQLYSSPLAMKWSKMLTNLLGNASSAILNMTPAEIFNHPDLYRIEIYQIREALTVMHTLNIATVDLPGVPTRLFAWLVNQLPPYLSRPLISRFAGKGRGQKMPSFYIDLQSRRGKSEVDYLNGAVVRAGERLQIPTPINQWLNQTLLSLVQGNLPLERFSHQSDQYIKAITSSQVNA